MGKIPMAKFNILVIDPPWKMSDKLTMSSTKRGAAANYTEMNDQDIINLDVSSITDTNTLLALWVPSAKLEEGMRTMKAWGFKQKQTWVWVKIQKHGLEKLSKEAKALSKDKFTKPNVSQVIENFDLNEMTSMYMGQYFRQSHEIVLIGIKGKMSSLRESKGETSVLFAVNPRHSQKPEGLQDRLEKMYPSIKYKKAELFARRARAGWSCVGNECPTTMGQDIRDSIKVLASS